MTVVSIGEYKFEPKDRVENFHGNQLVYLQWEQHLMFCAPFCFPLPPDMPFAAMVSDVMTPTYAAHPEAAEADFTKGEWMLDGKPFQPDFTKSLKDNGVGHKSVLRVKTPGLNGIAGTGA